MLIFTISVYGSFPRCHIAQNHLFSNVLGATFVPEAKLVVVCVLSVDARCAAQLAHFMQVENSAAFVALVITRRATAPPRGSVIANSDARNIVVQMGMYLGFIKVRTHPPFCTYTHTDIHSLTHTHTWYQAG